MPMIRIQRRGSSGERNQGREMALDSQVQSCLTITFEVGETDWKPPLRVHPRAAGEVKT